MKALVMVLLVSWVVLSWGQQEIDDYSDESVEQLMCRDPGYYSVADKCYRFHQTMRSWEAARSVCRGEGADLASVLDQAQYLGLLDHLNSNYPGTYWVSGQTSGGQWVWRSDGNRSVNRQWWGRAPPTTAGLCAYFCSNTNKYWPSLCTNSKRFICQKMPTM